MKFYVQGGHFLCEISGCDYYTAHPEIQHWLKKHDVLHKKITGNHGLLVFDIPEKDNAIAFRLRWADECLKVVE